MFAKYGPISFIRSGEDTVEEDSEDWSRTSKYMSGEMEVLGDSER